MLTKFITFLLSLILTLGCEGSLKVQPLSLGKTQITDVGSVEVEENDQVTVKGLNFSSKLMLEINDAVTTLNIVSGTEAAFRVPSFGDSDLMYAMFKQNSTTVEIPFF